MSFGVIFIAVVFQLTIGSVLSAVVLRAACALFNQLFGKDVVTPVANEIEFPPITSQPVEDNNPYRATLTSASPNVSSAMAGGVVVPDFLRAMGIMFLSIFSGFVFSFLLGLAIGSIGVFGRAEAAIIATVLGGLSGLVIQSLFISNMLPTSFGRAIAISIFMFLIVLVIAVAVGIVVWGGGMLVGPVLGSN